MHRNRFGRYLAVGTAFLWCFASSALADDSAKSEESTPRYTFSWPLEGDAPKPRGGTTKGPPVTLDKGPSPEWQALQEQGLADLERDRRAIRAMAGTYRVTFDFLEVTPFVPPSEPLRPYQSWATEKIYVDSDQEDFISLVHILEMRIVQQDGSLSDPMVTKHWRQDWRYEPTHLVEYRGHDRWERRKLGADERRGAWSQTVYQVDESPRYASIGRWEHTGTFSTWLSGKTWRPLPRREWSVRDDYNVLVGTNRHTVESSGWVQEENNLKTVLTDDRSLDTQRPYVGREYGIARYERIRGTSFDAADRYYERTRHFWDQVRDSWSGVFEDRQEVTLRGAVDKLGMFRPLFARASEIEAQALAPSPKDEEIIRSTLRDMGALK